MIKNLIILLLCVIIGAFIIRVFLFSLGVLVIIAGVLYFLYLIANKKDQ